VDHHPEEFVVNRTWILAATGTGTVLIFVTAFVLLQAGLRQQHLAARMEMSRGHAPLSVGTRVDMVKGAWSWLLAALGQTILRTGLLSARTLTDLEITLASSKLRGRRGLEVFIGSKIGLLIGLPLGAMALLRGVHIPYMLTIVIPAGAAVIGLLLPDVVVRYRRNKYLQRVEHGLPDALDLLMICAQAGLGLSAAIVRVSDEMQEGEQDIGVELALTANELQLLDTRRALLNMGSRTGIDGLVRLANTLLQSMQYGTPLTEAMRVLSAEMRQDTLNRFEARAARLGVLLTLPMIIFILPCVFLVVAGPAAIQVLHIGSH
jgi:tight adherence protein C